MEYIIENQFLRVTVISKGAQIKSVVRKCDGVEHMWNGNPGIWGYHSPVMFPYAGKVTGNTLEIRGQKVENVPQHGFHRTMEHDFVEQTEDSVTFAISANENTLKIFPYQFRLLTTIHLDGESVCHKLKVENLDTEAFKFGIGYHPAYAIPFDNAHVATDYEFRFSDLESPICLETPTGLLNGKYYSLGTNMKSIPVEEGMFDAGSHCMVNLRSSTLGIYEKNSNRAVVCNIEGFPYCLIWGKPGMPPFLCIEPWHSVPSYEEGSCAWEDKAAAACLAAGESWSTTMKTSFIR